MTTRTWNGSSAAYAAASNWSPAGVPTSGDVAVINAGTVSVNPGDLAANLLLQLSSSATATEIDLTNVTIQAGDTVTGNSGAAQLVIGATGQVTNQGVMVFSQSGIGNDIVALAGGTTFTNTGAINMINSITLFQAAGADTTGQMVNNGLITMHASPGANELTFSRVNISGSGTIQVGAGYRFETTGAISANQKIVMESSNGQGSILAIDNLPAALAPVYGFTASDQIFVTSQPYDTAIASFANGISTITFTKANVKIASINLVGNYNTSNVSIASSVNATSGFEQTQITTSVADATGTSGIIGTYRFFDKNTGTHFFTADAGEKNTVINTLPNYVEETNGFGAVDPAAQDPTAINVYRFFDTRFGTHFFTASSSERDTVLATRSDLTYEAGSTFLEHGTQQAGDVAVYRFFDTKFGTHFYTGDQAEYTGLTTPGSATYRTDLTNEGVGFYAPAGSFK